ncbi:MAG TPA: glycosyltransferase [Marisediminicola sp.]|nr:glycosyltransferase [Marisediminicola sp.]
MLPLVNVGHKSLGDYATLVSRGLMDEIRRLAEPLQGKRVAHVSATAFGGGVAEINYTLVPLMADAGLEVEWRIIRGAEEFFNVTKAIHNGLQGDPRSLTEEERAIFRRYNEENAADFPADDYDYVIIHDPQPIAMIEAFPERKAKWIWRGHIDFSTPNPDVLDVLLPSLRRYDDAIFHMPEYVPRADDLPEIVIWPPAIDPLMPKNMALSPEDAAYILDQFGIDVERPILTQVSRFDPWKDPIGVIDAYRIVKREFPGVQLALVGSMAHDDPEGWDYYNRTLEYADDDPDIYILSNMNSVGAVEVNAFQVHSAALIQKSIKEGFGLTVTEALWKSKPMVAGRVGGIVAQITDGETGWLVSSVEECAQACIEVLRDPVAARTRALRGKEHVRRHFLTPRLLRDWLVLFNRLAGNDTGGSTITVV